MHGSELVVISQQAGPAMSSHGEIDIFPSKELAEP